MHLVENKWMEGCSLGFLRIECDDLLVDRKNINTANEHIGYVV